jgi:tellurite resistance protein TerC
MDWISAYWPWLAFVVFVLAMLALDLGVFHRKAHEVSTKEALTWSAVWISLAFVFCGLIYFFWDKIPHEDSGYTNSQAALSFLTGYIVEKALSVDNVFVILMLFTYFSIPSKYQHRVLFWGIIGVLVMRAGMIFAGVALIKKFDWMVYIFGLILIAAAIKMIVMKDKEIEPEKNPVLKLFRRIMPITKELHGQQFFTRVNGKLWATPLFVVLLLVEATDLMFAIDSVPAIIAITRDPFLVFTSNIFAILGLRSLYFAIAGLMGMFAYLAYGLSAILAFVGIKMMLQGPILDYKMPVEWSLGVILSILAISIGASKLFPSKGDTAHGHITAGPVLEDVGNDPPAPKSEAVAL